jgi:hypothetical protein
MHGFIQKHPNILGQNRLLAAHFVTAKSKRIQIVIANWQKIL